MTITSTPSEVSYQGDDVSTSFPIPYVFDTAADLKVVRTDSDGNTLVLMTGFSVSGGNGSTGTLTLDAPLGAGYRLTIIDDPEAKQDTDYVANDSFPAETHERALDYLTRLVKRLLTKFERTLRVADGDPAGGSGMEIGSVQNRKGKYLTFDDNGDVALTVPLEPGDLNAQNWKAVVDADDVGSVLYPVEDAEIAAGVAPVNFRYRVGDIRRYGTTDPTGVLSSNDAIQAAVAVALQATGRVFIPSGRWRFTETILIDDTITLEGEDTDGAVLLKDGNFVGIEINTAPTSAAQPTLRNFTLDSAGGSDASPGIQINEFRAHIKQVTVQNQGSHGIECLYSNLSYLADLKLLNNAGDGLKLNGTTSPDTNAMTIINVDARGNGGWGINLEAGWANFIWGCQTSFNTGGGIRFNNARSNIVFIYSEANTGSSCKFEDHATCVGNLVFINEGFPTFDGSTADSNTVVRHQRGPVYDFNFNKVTADKFILPNVLQDGTSVRGILTAQHTVDDRFDFVASGSGAGTFPRVRLIGPDAPTTPLSFETDGRVFAALGLYPAGDTGPSWRSGSGSPEGVVDAAVGSLWSDTTNGVLYFKSGGGGGNTGWVAVTLAS